MLLFKKKDLLVVISKSGETVQFTKPLKDILKYQYRYNYKFVMYENGAVTVADDYVINGETLTVLFGSATVAYTSEGASYTEGGSGGEGGDSALFLTVTYAFNETTEEYVYSASMTYDELLENIEDLKGVIYRNDSDNYKGSAVEWLISDRTSVFSAEFYTSNGFLGTITISPLNEIVFNPVTGEIT